MGTQIRHFCPGLATRKWFCATLCDVDHLKYWFRSKHQIVVPTRDHCVPVLLSGSWLILMSLFCACLPYTRRQSHLNHCSMTQGLACPNAALTLDKQTISYKLQARFRSGRTVPGHRVPCVNVAKPQAEPSTNARRAAVSPAQTRQQSKQTKRKEGNLSSRRLARSCCQTDALNKHCHEHMNYRCPRS